MIALFASLSLALAPQGEAEAPLASFQLAGRTAFVTTDDLALELAHRYYRSPRGRAAVRQLVDLHLVRTEATAKGLMPKPEEVAALAGQLEAQLRATGQDFAEFLAERRMSRSQFEAEVLSLGQAQRNLTMDALGLSSPDAVSADMMELWLRQARNQAGVVEDPGELPDGYAAKVGNRLLSLMDMGRLLLTSAPHQEREQFIRQMVVLRCLEAEAVARSIEVTDEEARAEVEARKNAADRDSRYGGLRLEQVLLSQGMTMEGLARWPVLRAQIIERKLVDLEYSPEDLRHMLDEDRAQILKRHGPRRQLGILFVRALDEPNDLVPRDFAAAESHLRGVRDRIRSAGLPFSTAARQYSDDPATRANGGTAGWHRPIDQGLPSEVIEAAFALPRDGLSDPVRIDSGYYLVRVLEIEPMPGDATLLQKLHTDLETQLRQRILDEAKLEIL